MLFGLAGPGARPRRKIVAAMIAARMRLGARPGAGERSPAAAGVSPVQTASGGPQEAFAPKGAQRGSTVPAGVFRCLFTAPLTKACRPFSQE